MFCELVGMQSGDVPISKSSSRAPACLPDDHYHPIMQGIFGKGCDPLVKRSHDLLNIRCLQPIWRWSSGRTPYFIFLICILPYFVPSLWLLVARMVSTSAVHLSVSNFGDSGGKSGYFDTCPKSRQAWVFEC